MGDEVVTGGVALGDEVEGVEGEHDRETRLELERDHSQLVEVEDNFDDGFPDLETEDPE